MTTEAGRLNMMSSANGVREARADWSRVAGGGPALDLLTVRSAPSKTWCFVWPGRIVVQALSAGVDWCHLESREELRPGCILVLDAFATQTRIVTLSRASLRVVFELETREGVSPRVRARPPYAGPQFDIELGPTKLFREGIAGAGPMVTHIRSFTGPVARARGYIEENLTEEFDLQDLGASAGVDRCHLCRVFQRAIGLPPYRFRAHLRVARARELLASGLDCTQVAFAVGFCDQSHLTRCFKEFTGTTPGAYARACRASVGESRPSAA